MTVPRTDAALDVSLSAPTHRKVSLQALTGDAHENVADIAGVMGHQGTKYLLPMKQHDLNRPLGCEKIVWKLCVVMATEPIDRDQFVPREEWPNRLEQEPKHVIYIQSAPDVMVKAVRRTGFVGKVGLGKGKIRL